MSSLDALYGAILDDQGDLTLWSAYADALEESEYSEALSPQIIWLRKCIASQDMYYLAGWIHCEGTVEAERGWRDANLKLHMGVRK